MTEKTIQIDTIQYIRAFWVYFSQALEKQDVAKISRLEYMRFVSDIVRKYLNKSVVNDALNENETALRKDVKRYIQYIVQETKKMPVDFFLELKQQIDSYNDRTLKGTATEIVCMNQYDYNPNGYVPNSPYTFLIQAVRDNNLRWVKQLVADGADINLCIKDGTSAIQSAEIFGNWDMITFLLKNGADINLQDCHGDGFLRNTIRRPYDDTLLALMKQYGADLNIRGFHQNTLLMDCCGGYDPINREKWGCAFIDAGVDVNLEDRFGRTALNILATGGGQYWKENLAQKLIFAGADVNHSYLSEAPYGVSFGKHTPLIDAINHGNVEGVRFLLKNGAEMNLGYDDRHHLNSLALVKKLKDQFFCKAERIDRLNQIETLLKQHKSCRQVAQRTWTKIRQHLFGMERE